MSLDLLAVLGLDTGATLKTAYDFCAAPPPKEALLEWCEKALAIARRLDEKGRPEVLRATLEEIVALVEAHPASFAEAAKWADERWAEAPGPWAIRLLDALASAPELAAIDATEAASALDVDRLLASLPAEKLAAADEALRASREWKAAVQKLFDRARASAELPRFAAQTAAEEEDHVLLERIGKGELVLTRSHAEVYVDWYGPGEPALFVGDVELSPRNLPQGEGRRWPLPSLSRPIWLRLVAEDVAHSFEIPD